MVTSISLNAVASVKPDIQVPSFARLLLVWAGAYRWKCTTSTAEGANSQSVVVVLLTAMLLL